MWSSVVVDYLVFDIGLQMSEMDLSQSRHGGLGPSTRSMPKDLYNRRSDDETSRVESKRSGSSSETGYVLELLKVSCKPTHQPTKQHVCEVRYGDLLLLFQ